MGNRAEEETTSPPRQVTEPFRAALNGDWEGMKKFYEMDSKKAALPLTLTNDTPLHIAVYSGSKSPLEELLRIVPNDHFMRQNDYLNTPLHEAGVIGNVEAAKILVRCSEAQLDVRNILGETPMFRAAAFGVTKMVHYLDEQVQRVQGDMDIQHLRDDGTSILHIAIYGQHFETALWLLRKHKKLGELKDKYGWTCLHLLAKMPSAFKSGYPMGKFTAFIYSCLPSDENDDEAQQHYSQSNDVECGRDENDHLYQSRHLPNFRSAISRMYSTFWKCIAQGWPMVETIWKEKRKHEMALRLAKLLVVNDTSWEQTHTKPDMGSISFGGKVKHLGKEEEMVNSLNLEGSIKGEGTTWDNSITIQQQPQEETDTNSSSVSPTAPLLLATKSGIVEIVEEILQEFPQAVEHVSEQGQHIMHVAIRYRQKEIFCLVKEIMRIPMSRLVRKIDNDGNTLLHHVADITGYGTGRGTQPNPALQLQDELQWFESVKELIPSYYEMHHNKNNEAAQEYFERTHSELLKEAQNWLKRTSESCSVIAVLIATVAFTAAYTVPGGSNEKTGLPILLHDPFFHVFTVMDVVSLVSSLTSVVMFISIVTSPFQLQDFRHSLPRKLTLAFTSLFLSVAATMLAFSATVILIIHMKKRWTTTVVYAVAFVPVTVFALLQFPLYVALMGTLRYSISVVKKVLPLNFGRRLFTMRITAPFGGANERTA